MSVGAVGAINAFVGRLVCYICRQIGRETRTSTDYIDCLDEKLCEVGRCRCVAERREDADFYTRCGGVL